MPDQPDLGPDDGQELLAVIRLLSPKAAAHLRAVSYDHAKLVVQELGLMIKYWEAAGVTLDPIQREVVLDSIVYGLSAIALSFERAVTNVAETLQRKHFPVSAPAVGDQVPPGEG